MTNKAIANAFDELASLMELHEEDDFRIRTYRNTYLNLRKLDRPLAEMNDAEIKSIKGIGDATSKKIRELLSSGQMASLEKYKSDTPPGVVEMLDINGFGPKKVRAVWKEMGIESIGELLYACNENRLVEYKGFGLKTQEDLHKKLHYYLRSKNKLHLDAAEEAADAMCILLSNQLPGAVVQPVGALRRNCPVIDTVELLMAFDGDPYPTLSAIEGLHVEQSDAQTTYLQLEGGARICLHQCKHEEFGSKLFRFSGTQAFLEAFAQAVPGVDFRNLPSETAVFEKAGMPFVHPALREDGHAVELARQGKLPDLITENDIKGVLHVHSTWSDGLHSLEDMCLYAQSLGYAYIGITDHSQSAFYANGLKPDRVLAQMEEIDRLNEKMAPFRIFKGIESDILNDGSLDYEEDILRRFDFVIASVHSNLRMPIEKATERLLRAIENPYTTILGHPTGRLLLSREGYPLNWDKILDACARHNTAIELNANPYRLDIDYTLIPRAIALGIPISINPDAHSKDGIHAIRYGIMVAQKGGMSAANSFKMDL